MLEITDIPDILRRHIAWLIILPIVLVVLALAYVTFKTPIYRTSAELLVQPEGVQIIANDPVASSNNQSLQGMDLDSQTYVILSAAVLNQVANNLDLDNSSRFFQPGLRARLFGTSASDSRSSSEARNATIAALRDAIQVFRLNRSFVFSILVSHPDADLAAAIANETANAYIEQSRDSRAEALARASTTLSKQAEQLRSRVETAEAAVEAYKAKQGLISTAGGSVVDQQLDALNTQITDARVELERTKALYDQMAPLTLSDVEAGAVPQGSESSVLNSLRVQYARIAQQEAEAATTLGTNHPTLRELRSQLSNTQRQIQNELQRIKQSVRSEFEQAQATVNALEQQSRNLQSQNTVQGKALIELRQLQSEADASRAVYEAFLKRARELEELPELDTNTSRILSEAPVPISASGPRKIVVLAAAALFGFVLAASAAVGLSILQGPMVSERLLVKRTGVPILADLSSPSGGTRSRSWLPGWLTGRSGRHSDQNEIAQTRVAYALRQSIADNRPANILVLSIGQTGDTSGFVRSVAEEMHSMGEEVLFAHTTEANRDVSDAPEPQPVDGAKLNNLNRLASKLSGMKDAEHQDATGLTGTARKRGLAGYLRVEQIDPRRKYASGGNLDSASEDYLLVDAGNIDKSPMLPVLLRHCDGIILITALGSTRASDFERATVYLEPWHDRLIGNVVLKPV